ncbi:MAG: peptidylprolyl isomerase [Solirubrobacterales bacterium]
MAPARSKGKIVVAAIGMIALVAIGILVALPGDDEQPARVVVKEGSIQRPAPGEALARGERATVRFETNLGTFAVALDGERSPIAANNFAYLARSGFYDGLGFHRIVPGFVIQGGDPRGDGTGGPGYRVVDPPERGAIYGPGTVAMAKSAADPRGAAGSQFFIVTADRPIDLPAEYAIVGQVSAGRSVVEEIGRLGGPDEIPTETVVIERARLIEE